MDTEIRVAGENLVHIRHYIPCREKRVQGKFYQPSEVLYNFIYPGI